MLPERNKVAPKTPAAFFGIVLGLAGLGNAWRAAHVVWHLPGVIGETLEAVAALVWAVLIVLFGLKWVLARADAVAEAHHPVQCCFIGLIGVATMLVAVGADPYSRVVAVVLFGAGALFTVVFAVWRTGVLWQGGREMEMTTPVLYLPTVAAGFVTAAAASALGAADWGQLAFGAALFSWLAIESVLLHRLYTSTMAAALRPTLGIQLAPPAVGAVAYIGVNGGHPDLIAHAFIGYALLQALLLARLLPWIVKQGFAPSYWAFTFGATALAAAPLRLLEHGDGGAMAVLAPPLFVTANGVVLLVAAGTLWLLAQRRLLPAAVASAARPAGRA